MKKAMILYILIFSIGFAGIWLIFRQSSPQMPSIIVINDAVKTTLMQSNTELAVDFLTEQILLEYENANAKNEIRQQRLKLFLYIITFVFLVTGMCLYWHCEHSILRPFRKLQQFAGRVAAGNLDIPLEMDRHERFGAFSESFDLMREELKRAKENERKADRSKKELIASISHDIKTPIASIKAAIEYMRVSIDNNNHIALLIRIDEKAEQINSLITDMFHATLEELEQLAVNPTEIQSTAMTPLIQNADYMNRIQAFTIPNCMIWCDIVRLQQIFDNIIGNSYKYADTAIEIQSFFDEQFLVICMSDSGPGVSDDELPLLCNKFYRGQHSHEKSGYGLGLFISKSLLEQMHGRLYCENHSGGFSVKIHIPLLNELRNC